MKSIMGIAASVLLCQAFGREDFYAGGGQMHPAVRDPLDGEERDLPFERAMAAEQELDFDEVPGTNKVADPQEEEEEEEEDLDLDEEEEEEEADDEEEDDEDESDEDDEE